MIDINSIFVIQYQAIKQQLLNKFIKTIDEQRFSNKEIVFKRHGMYFPDSIWYVDHFDKIYKR